MKNDGDSINSSKFKVASTVNNVCVENRRPE